nr:glucuronate isomerase [Bradyrhizobium japonicum]
MNVHAAGDLKFTGLTHPNGSPLRLNAQDFVAVDRDRNARFEATYRPQALYNRANEGFHANNETFLLHEVATNLPIYRPDTGPTDFHLHLPPGGFQLVLVTSGAFTFDYDGRFYNVGPAR